MRLIVNQANLSIEQAEELLLKPRDRIALDVETISIENPLPLGIAVGVDENLGFYFFDPRDKLLQEVVAQTPTILTHNAAFDLPILYKLGFTIQNYEDTMLQAYAGGILDKSLVSLSETILLKNCPSVTSQWKKKDQGNIAIDHVKMGSMSIIHACNTYALWGILPKTRLYYDIDRPCVDLVMEMEKWGVLIDQVKLTEVEQETIVKANQMEQELKEELGNINLASNPQVVKALQAKGILGTRKTKGGAQSVSEESLRPLDHPLTNKLLDYRSEVKTLSTYVPSFRRPDTNRRIHTRFGYTSTGRWTSSAPNLQNITNNGLRLCIVAEQGYTYLSLDASQIELRVVANLSQDPLLLKALQSEDLHLATAIQVFGWTDDKEEMAKRRYNAKQLNFAVLYGADDYKVSKMAGCSIEEAQELIRAYFDKYRVLYQWIQALKAKAKEDGFVTNLFGRVRPIPELNAGSWKLREAALREAVNMPVQGTAVDIVKMMMLYLRGIFPPSHRLVLQVHDEILFEIPDELMGRALDVVEELEQAFPDYPTTIKVGKIYGELKEVE